MLPLDLVGPRTHDCESPPVWRNMALSEQVRWSSSISMRRSCRCSLGLADATVPQLRSQRLLLGRSRMCAQGLAVCRLRPLPMAPVYLI